MNKTDKLLSLCRKFYLSKIISYYFPKEVLFISDYVQCFLDTCVSADSFFTPKQVPLCKTSNCMWLYITKLSTVIFCIKIFVCLKLLEDVEGEQSFSGVLLYIIWCFEFLIGA